GRCHLRSAHPLCTSPSADLPLAPSAFSRLLAFFFTHTPPTEIYPLSLHDALPICTCTKLSPRRTHAAAKPARSPITPALRRHARSEEHTSELQSLTNLVCRLLLEKKKKTDRHTTTHGRTHLTLRTQ